MASKLYHNPSLFLLLICYTNANFGDDQTIRINLLEGTVRGQLEAAESGSKYFGFYGIPYALPPIKKRRFMKPEPVEKWDREVGGDIVECAQEDSGREKMFVLGDDVLRGQEDCLVVNIYTPTLNSKLPVIVFVHGGGYFAGSGPSLSRHDPEMTKKFFDLSKY